MKLGRLPLCLVSCDAAGQISDIVGAALMLRERIGLPLLTCFEHSPELKKAMSEDDAVLVGPLRPVGDRRALLLHIGARHDGERYVALTDAGEIASELAELRKRSEELVELRAALDVSERRYRNVLETANEGIWIVDEDAQTTYANRKLGEMLGYDPAEMLGRPMFDFMDERAQLDAMENFERRQAGVEETHDFRFTHRDGHAVRTLVTTSPLLDDSGAFRGALGMVTDITERRALEERVLHAQKLEAVGRLAGGVAHDFNNVLTSIIGCAETLGEELGADHELSVEVRTILAAAERAGRLTRELLTFARRRPADLRVIDLRQLVRGARGMLAGVLTEAVALDVRLASERVLVRADAVQVEQALINLVLNAKQAMPRGGTVTIAVRADSAEGDRSGVLSVSDTGCGMPPEVRERVFEPFFTTREAGSGLGLAMVYAAVQQAGGRARVESEPGCGATFELSFPLVHGRDPDAEPSEVRSSLPELAGRHAFVVEDDVLVARVMRRVLATRGARVTLALSCDEAKRLAREATETFDVVISDVVLSDGDGIGLRAELREWLGDVPTLFVTGHAADVLGARGVERDTLNVLDKPFTGEQLLARVGALLSG